ncbi:MAG: NAD(P)H-dependent oxidoreductase [Cryobacterium sp.]|nr:NAD(P)H-dependent oxidoreductase [Oligoflexia bacterium]
MKTENQALHWRYATKGFNPEKKVPEEKLKEILETARMAPTSYGLQPFHVTVVKDQALREKLKPFSWNQAQITDCSHLVVFQSRIRIDEKLVNDYIELISKTRGVPVATLEGFRGMMLSTAAKEPGSATSQEWAKRQAYIAMGFLLHSAAMHEVDACPIEGIDGAEYDRLLGADAKGLQTVVVVALGHRAESDAYQNLKKVRQPVEQFFSFV